jgi:hypothetical protein
MLGDLKIARDRWNNLNPLSEIPLFLDGGI